MSGQQNSDFFLLFGSILEEEDEWPDGVLMNGDCNWNFDLLILRKEGIIEGIPLYLILICIHNLDLHLFELILRVVCQMDEDVYLIRLFEGRNDSDFNSIRFVKKFFLFQT